jgi:hypothetical protein
MNPVPVTPQANKPDLKVIPFQGAAAPNDESWGKFKSLRGQLWCEWYAHSRFLLTCIAFWLVAIWVLSLCADPAWMLLFAGVYALWAGPRFGGSDTIDACEEFTLALPPTRGERYATRLLVGGGALLLFTAIDLLALGLDLPQVLAKIYVQAGMIQPQPILNSGLLYGLVLTLPLAIFAVSFALSAVTHSRRLVLTASFWAVLVSLGALRVGFWYEDLVWGSLNGYFACPLLTTISVAVLWAGARAYASKEIGPQSTPTLLPARWVLWSGLFVLALLLGMGLSSSLLANGSRLLH